MRKNYYEILGVDKGASPAEIRRAYRELARQHHPDVNKDLGAEERMREINEAYECLSNPQRRADYDRTLQLPLARSDLRERFMFTEDDLRLIAALKEAYLLNKDGWWGVVGSYDEGWGRRRYIFLVERKDGQVNFWEEKMTSSLGWDWVIETSNTPFGGALKSMARKLAEAQLPKAGNKPQEINLTDEIIVINKYAETRPAWLEGGLKEISIPDLARELERAKSAVSNLGNSKTERENMPSEKKG